MRQLQSVGIGSNRLRFAKRDYYRAFTQRSQWLRQSLLFDGEVARFERTLVEEWQPRFEMMCDGLDPGNADAKLRQAGQDRYHWVETEARFPFRTISERFLNVGSYHILANDLRLGWHRDYLILLNVEADPSGI
ncbi:ABC-three component system protein [Bradyrhizobium sp. S3.2.12]|uniref:ABC-three component system protein n=1 Tax=Bradyrhizobium sp. S3.2.12 TaxID=3156387 RepID=UPI0033961AA1